MPLLQEVPELVVPDRSCCVSLEMIVVGLNKESVLFCGVAISMFRMDEDYKILVIAHQVRSIGGHWDMSSPLV
jgi:hypothetical protein